MRRNVKLVDDVLKTYHEEGYKGVYTTSSL